MSNRVKLEHAIKQVLSEEGHVLLISQNPPRSLDRDLKNEIKYSCNMFERYLKILDIYKN